MLLKKIHFCIGLAVIIHFIATGVLMRINFFEIEQQDILGRMMFRSNHIYILFSGLVNLLVSYVLNDEAIPKKYLYLASSILLLATIGLSLSFYTDPISHSIQRDITRFSVIGCLVGTAIHLLLLRRYKHFW